ncbi:MAG: sugar phosphate nucleotidyltransferase [Nitrospiraceae bacterium]
MNWGNREGHVWSIILAGGDGVRTQPFIRRWLGEDKPKQYCAFVGTRSMFQHTVDRAAKLSPAERIVVVAARHHQDEVWAQLDRRSVGMVLLQPNNAGTAPGIFLPLTYIRARDPHATVIVYPSDHFIYPEERFLTLVDHAVCTSTLRQGRPILLAALPDGLELEYGWIEPGPVMAWTGRHQVREVRAFLEKPDHAQARRAMARGAVWNTLVIAAKADALWELGRRCVPEIMPLFKRLRDAIDTPHEVRVLEHIYQEMPNLNFSSDVLQRIPEQLGVMGLSGVVWSDWGKPERIATTLEKIGKQPAFAMEHLVAIA